MLKRGYLILIIGAALVAIGIIITTAYGMSIASVILSESIIMTGVLVDPAESLNHTLSITNIERPVSILLHVEPAPNNGINTNSPTVEQKVIDPRGFTINRNQFGGEAQSELFTSFEPETDGIYTLFIYNPGTEQIRIEGLFGYLPITENNGEVSLAPVTGLLAGAILVIIGIITLIAGTVTVILDRRRDNKRQSLGLSSQ
jgi:hypothetical protein